MAKYMSEYFPNAFKEHFWSPKKYIIINVVIIIIIIIDDESPKIKKYILNKFFIF
jgi:hypothetical protein